MQFVRVYALEEDFESREVGRIYSDGRRVWAVPDDGRTAYIASQPIYLPADDGSTREIRPGDDPDGFLHALPVQYHGTRLWCTRPETSLE